MVNRWTEARQAPVVARVAVSSGPVRIRGCRTSTDGSGKSSWNRTRLSVIPRRSVSDAPGGHQRRRAGFRFLRCRSVNGMCAGVNGPCEGRVCAAPCGSFSTPCAQRTAVVKVQVETLVHAWLCTPRDVLSRGCDNEVMRTGLSRLVGCSAEAGAEGYNRAAGR